MKKGKIILSGILIWIVGTIWSALTCGWLFNWVYTIEPVIWKAPAEMFTTTNLILSNVFGILIAIIFTAVYAFLYQSLPYKGVKKGLVYGFIIWLVSAFSGMLTMPFYMTISWIVIVYWILNALVANLIFGAIVGAVYKEKTKKKKK